jgi:hypothetical protein
MSAVSPVPPTFVACPACGFTVAPDALTRENETACPQCRAVLSGGLFPAFWNPEPVAQSLADHAGDGEAVCFFHPENRAALSCDRCGRFICAVCDMPLGTRHLCPTCLSSGLGGEKLPELVVSRFVWSQTALLIGLLPLLVFPLVWPGLIVTGPAAIFCALFGWKRPGSLPRGRRHWLAVLGLVCGLLQLTIWFGFLFLLSNSSFWAQTFR